MKVASTLCAASLGWTSGGRALCSIVVAAALHAAPPALAQPPPALDAAIVEVSKTSYPLIRALRAETFIPFTDKVGDLLLELPPEKLGTTIDLSIGVFNSVPDEAVSSFEAVVKDAFTDLKTESCTLVPLPSAAKAKALATLANSKVDSAKLEAARAKWGPVLKELP